MVITNAEKHAGYSTPRRVLVAEPDDKLRQRYGSAFVEAGWEVIETVEGRDALTHALTRAPELIVTEVALPLIDGFALCRVLRGDAMTRHTPILAVTAEASAFEHDRALRAGADRVLLKPVSAAVLLSEAALVVGVAARRRDGDAAPHAGHDGTPPANTRRPQSKAYSRFVTKTPPVPPPPQHCPSCRRPLRYDHSFIGGVSKRYPEQWDQLVCPHDGETFLFRHASRTLRRLA